MDANNRIQEGQYIASLLDRISRSRDHQAFVELFLKFAPRIKGWMMQSGVDHVLAEEMVQDTMAIIWQKCSSFDPAKSSPTTWIFTVARNHRISCLRDERHASIMFTEGDFEYVDEYADDVVGLHERDALISEAVKQLPPDQEAVIRAAYCEDMSHSDMVRSLGVPLGTVKSRMRLALARLRQYLGGFIL